MVDNSEVMLQQTYEANSAISEAVTNILHSSDLTSLSALAHQGESTREKEPRVKRPMNAFMLYAQVARRKVATKYPNLNYAKLSKTLGKIWQVLPEEERRPFIQEAERLRTQHKLKHPDYKYTPKRLKSKKHNGASMKKTRYENLKPEELFNIIQAKCDPGSPQMCGNPNGLPMAYNEELPMYYNDSVYSGQAYDPFCSASPTTSVNSYDGLDYQGLDYGLGGLPARGLNGLETGMSSAPNNDLKCYFPDYNGNQLLALDSFNNNLHNSFLSSPKTNYNSLTSNQPLSAFLASKPEPTLSPLANLNSFSDEGFNFSKLVDPIENISSYLEGKSYIPGYLTV